MDDSQDSTMMDTMDDSTNMSFDTEASHQGFPEIPVVKTTVKKVNQSLYVEFKVYLIAMKFKVYSKFVLYS
jgi:hypothetical protein